MTSLGCRLQVAGCGFVLPQLLVGPPRRDGGVTAVSAKPPCLTEAIRRSNRPVQRATCNL
jgi:hypothetical protein